MPSCLGIYTDKNVIKYAKITSNAERNGTNYSLDAYGVKFFDNIQTAVDEIVAEVGLDQDPLALTLSNEEYFIEQVFSNINKKDTLELVKSDYSEKTGTMFSDAIMESRLKTSLNSGSLDKKLVMLIVASKGELANIRQNFGMYKIESISPLPISIKNLFVNQGIDEESAVINIEDRTTITVFHNSEINYIAELPVGANDIIAKLTEKYNSVSKAYDALKKVSIYSDEVYDLDDESKEILDTVVPIMYDIRQQSDDILTPFLKNIKKIYLSGTGAIVGNVDLYFKETFLDYECEILNPFFISKSSSNINDIVETNSAIALALDGVGMADTDLNFNSASKKAAGITAAKEIVAKLNIKENVAKFKTQTTDFFKKLNAPAVKKKRKAKRNIDFDTGLIQGKDNDATDTEEVAADSNSLGRVDLGCRVLSMIGVVAFVFYIVTAIQTNNQLLAKDVDVKNEISKAEASISVANEDATYLNGAANEYVAIKDKLSALITKISQNSKITFDIPNFLSKLMFIMPSDVQVTSIDVDSTGDVTLNAQSGQYAQLGYLVSRLKLEGILEDVEMQVLSVDSNIKILIKGVLP